MTTYTVGALRDLLKNFNDDTPIVSAPLNDEIRVALNIEIYQDATLDTYKGPVVVFSTGLFDINSGKEIQLNSTNDS